MRYVLNERVPGFCPICRQYWYGRDCDCTRPQPDDDEQMQKAYLQSALCRRAQLTAAQRLPRPATDNHQERGSQSGNVVPFTRPPQSSSRRRTR